MIAFECPSCGKSLKVKDGLAGKKVKCPGCQKPAAVPQLAASLSPPPAAPADERTLPPKVPAGGEERTLPPKDRKKESVSDAGGLTGLGAGQAEFTQAIPGERLSAELTEFLAPPQQPDEIGRLGPYRVLKVLGHGGMGVVYRAEDPGLQRLVALKVMLPALANTGTAKQRFLREARTAASINHDNIVHIYQVGEDRGVPFMAMQFLEGEPLDECLKREKRLPAAEILRIAKETAKGLAAAHKRGLVHRDIKPANLWLEGEEARVKILDFGLARAAADDTHLTQTGAIVGTPAYMAPEQADGKAVDHRCDLFSLGCVLYRMCTGELPFKGDSTLAIISALAMHNPKEPSKINKSVPPPLSNLIMHLLAKNPTERPQSAAEVAEALHELASAFGEEPTATRTGKSTILQRRGDASPRRKWALVGGGVLGVLVLGLVVFFLASRERERPEESLPKTFTNSLGMEFVLVPKGKSWLGGGGGNLGTKEVEIGYDFYLGRYEVTQEEWEKLTGLNPSEFKSVAGVSTEDQKRFPVENVSWDDCQLFIERLNKQVKEAGWVYRLPTEVEWEYGCRGGPMKDKLESAFDFYFEKATNTLLPEQANFGHGKTCKVGSYQPNWLGLYDMHGNVYEWCADELKDDKGASQRVNRGGSWFSGASGCRAANRHSNEPSERHNNLGLRLTRVPVGKDIVKIIAPEEKKPADPKQSSTFKNSLGMEFVLVPKGKSWLGGGGGKPGDKKVEIKDDFYLGKYEVTQEEWEKVTGLNPSHFKSVPGVSKEDQKRFPVETVSWDEAQVFIKQVNAKQEETGWLYRLPTEVEWEYACRGGPMKAKFESTFDFYLEKPVNLLLPEQANVVHDNGKSPKRTCKVGSYKPNRLGLYDMHGNVWEWCDDEARLPNAASRRMLRGGGWLYEAEASRASRRQIPPSVLQNNIGLRLARVPIGKEIVKIIAPDEKKPAVEVKHTLGMEFVLVPTGKAWLGGGGGKSGDKEVEVLHDFYLGKYEVTQEEWAKVTGTNPSQSSRTGAGKDAVRDIPDEELKRFPVDSVSWDQAQLFLERFNERYKEAGWVYRLPTEAEWEYACRGGPGDKLESSFDFYFDKPTNQPLPEHANFQATGLKRSCKVGSYKPNRLGLHDMHGNVYEWCQDEAPHPKNPKNPKEASWRVLRGGSFNRSMIDFRAAHRYAGPSSSIMGDFGLRLARVPVGKQIIRIIDPEQKKSAVDSK